MDTGLRAHLEVFDAQEIGLSKGPLSLVLVMTRNARERKFPLTPRDFETPRGGQVAGLGGGAVKRILDDHGIERHLASEGGRTSRGSLDRMRSYVAFLNKMHAAGQMSDGTLEEIESYWIERVQAYFQSQPFKFKLDAARSVRSCVRDLFSQAIVRQREARGTMYAGAVMQHLVGAKLDLVLERGVQHHGFSVADAPGARSGDFFVGDVAIHVTTAPGEALIRKCKANLDNGHRPLIVTTEDGQGGAKALARQAGIDDRIDVIEIEQFIATNVYEISNFERERRPVTVRELVERYNRIVSACETDRSLRIEFEGGG